MQAHDQLRIGSAPDIAPSFKLVDSNNRVRELTDPFKRQLGGAFPSFFRPQVSDDGPSAAELEEQRQLEEQLQVQKEEMCFISPLPRHEASRLCVPSTTHAFTYGGVTSSTPHATPPLAPPVSPFASMALSAPAAPISKAYNPFLTVKLEKSSRLPSLNVMRSSPATHLKPLGIVSRSPPLSLQSFSDGSTLSTSSQSPSPSPSPLHQPRLLQQHHQSKAPLRSLSNSSLLSASSTSSLPSYSQSLPGVSYLQDRRRSRTSFDGADGMSVPSEDEDSGMRLLSSSVGRSEGSSDAMTAAAIVAAQEAQDINARSGRICRYANCSNIARSRGRCRTHGGGKRCSHPHCNKSAQANRKCIAHGGGTPCSFEDCEKTAQSRGLCKAHGGGARCKHPDCPKSSQSKGLCRGHGGGVKCKIEGCGKWVQKNGYCIKHGREVAETL